MRRIRSAACRPVSVRRHCSLDSFPHHEPAVPRPDTTRSIDRIAARATVAVVNAAARMSTGRRRSAQSCARSAHPTAPTARDVRRPERVVVRPGGSSRRRQARGVRTRTRGDDVYRPPHNKYGRAPQRGATATRTPRRTRGVDDARRRPLNWTPAPRLCPCAPSASGGSLGRRVPHRERVVRRQTRSSARAATHSTCDAFEPAINCAVSPWRADDQRPERVRPLDASQTLSVLSHDPDTTRACDWAATQ